MKPYFVDSSGRITLFHGNSRDIMPALSPSVVITDPPYGIPVGAAFVQRGGALVSDGGECWNETENPYDWLSSVPASVRTIASFIDSYTACDAERALIAAQFRVWAKFYLVKQAPPATPRPTFVSAVEECLIASREGAKRGWHGTGYEPNYWRGMTPNRLSEGVGHPAEKPLAPLETLVRCLTSESDVVLDPFAGSGTTLVACKVEGRVAFGIEREERYCELAARRLSQEVLNFQTHERL
jgi:site-specific DNA-methyltransferase (adenine-specific)